MKRMTRHFTILALALASVGVVTSCSKDDENYSGQTPANDKTSLWQAYNPTNDKWGYVNGNGEFVIPSQYDKTYAFSCGLGRISSGNKDYFVDTNGKIVSGGAVYDKTGDFYNGYALATKDGLMGLLDKRLEFVIAPLYHELGNAASNGLLYYRITADGKYGYLDVTSNLRIVAQYEVANDFVDDIAVVKSGTKYGAIDANGKWVIQPTYEYLHSIYNNLLITRKDGLYGMIDKNGKVVVPEVYRAIQYDQSSKESGLYCVEDQKGKFGYIDVNGNTRIECAYDEAQNFAENLAVVKKDDEYLLINTNNQVVKTYSKDAEIKDSHNGMVLVELTDRINVTVDPKIPLYSYSYTYEWTKQDGTVWYTWTRN